MTIRRIPADQNPTMGDLMDMHAQDSPDCRHAGFQLGAPDASTPNEFRCPACGWQTQTLGSGAHVAEDDANG